MRQLRLAHFLLANIAKVRRYIFKVATKMQNILLKGMIIISKILKKFTILIYICALLTGLTACFGNSGRPTGNEKVSPGTSM